MGGRDDEVVEKVCTLPSFSHTPHASPILQKAPWWRKKRLQHKWKADANHSQHCILPDDEAERRSGVCSFMNRNGGAHRSSQDVDDYTFPTWTHRSGAPLEQSSRGRVCYVALEKGSANIKFARTSPEQMATMFNAYHKRRIQKAQV